MVNQRFEKEKNLLNRKLLKQRTEHARGNYKRFKNKLINIIHLQKQIMI